jgi:hypothetical protein
MYKFFSLAPFLTLLRGVVFSLLNPYTTRQCAWHCLYLSYRKSATEPLKIDFSTICILFTPLLLTRKPFRLFCYFSIYFTKNVVEKFNLERMRAGQEDRQEEEDEREELQPEPLLERVLRLHH